MSVTVNPGERRFHSTSGQVETRCNRAASSGVPGRRSWRRWPGVRAGCLLLVLLTAGCKEEGTIQVHSIRFIGIHAFPDSRLKNVLATRESSKLPWGKKRWFDRARFDADIKRLQSFYNDRGYPAAHVTGFDVKLNAKQDEVDVTLTVSEGDPVKVASIEFTGFDAIPPEHLSDLRKHTPLKIGEPRDRQLVQATQELALNELRDHGFPYAKVSASESDAAQGGLALTFAGDPGTKAVFGPVAIAGNQSVGEDVIRRELAYSPGELYRRSLVQDTQRRLYTMELFQFATVTPVDSNEQSTEIPTRVTVAEGKHHRVKFGAGYGSEERVRADAEYHHLNFFGGARSAEIHGRWSSLDRGIRVDFTQPYVFHPHLSFNAEGQSWYTTTPAYDSLVSGGKLTLTHRSSRKTSWSVSFIDQRESSTIAPGVLNDLTLRDNLIALGLDPRTGQQTGTTVGVGFDVLQATVDNLLDAHYGYQMGVHVEQAGHVLNGTFSYTALSADFRHYLPLGDRFVLASRVQSGVIDPHGGDENIPFSKRYFLGGATSVRGWGRYELGPLTASGLPIGGNSMFAMTAELRASFANKLGAVVFLDGGNVWAGPGGIRLNDLYYAIGPGLRYQTPIGPLRFDFGYQLERLPNLVVDGQPESRPWRIHFSIGQAF
jgi:outer membrane protein assembly complex protein YaeT